MDLPLSLSEPKWLLLLFSIPPVVALGILSARARPRDRARINASTVLRATILLLIVLSLAGLQWVSSGGPLNVVFLVDESDSVSQQSRDAATNYVQKAIARMGPEDRAGVVLFGERAIIDRALSSDTTWKPAGKQPAKLATNIADAIQVGTALFPQGGSRRLVLLSDGVETIGKARDMARLVGHEPSEGGVQLSVVPMGAQSRNEVAIDRVASPNSVPGGQQFDVRVLLKSTSERAATISLFDGDQPAGSQQVQLHPGNNVVTFSVKPSDLGFHAFKARVESVDDYYAQNNEASAFTIVQKPPSVLIVAGSPADGAPLKAALAASNITADIIAPSALPEDPDALAKYDAVVLANASAQAIGQSGQERLQSYVRDLGHGLVMLGGDSSYGAGGYLRSPIEEVLPVSMDVRSSEQRASLAMTFVMDKSGSMGRCHCGGAQQFNPSMRTEFGPSKVEIAKQAIEKATAILNSSDQVGIVGFDQAPHWLLNLQTLGGVGQQGVVQALQPVEAQGDTNLAAGLQSAVDELQLADAKLKHVILVSDGWTQQGDFSAILNQMDQHRITLSTVGAGQGADPLLKKLAEQGGGRYYEAADVTSVPDIFLKETVRLVGSYYVERPFIPVAARASPILKGLNPNSLPQLLGYNGTTIKPTADLVLKSPAGDPVLAQWQYGLGRSAAWTPDVKGQWASDWVKWPQFAQFAGQMVGWTFPKESSPGLETGFTQVSGTSATGQDVAVQVHSVDSAGSPRNLLQTSVEISATGQLSKELAITQQSPGEYGGVAKGLQQGVYAVQVSQRDPTTGKLVASQTTGLVVPYPSEYSLSDDQALNARTLMSDLAQLGGGKELDIAQPAAVWSRDIASQPRPVPLWPWLLAFAIFLFPIDVAVRRLTVTRADLRRMLRLGH